jgi:hypothetical protein
MDDDYDDDPDCDDDPVTTLDDVVRALGDVRVAAESQDTVLSSIEHLLEQILARLDE